MTIVVNEEEDFHVVLNGNVVALSLNALDMAYQDDLISEETLIWQEGFAEWTRLDVLLAALDEQDGPVAPAPPTDPDMYSVLVAPEEVKQMSLDLLADAYRLEVIDDDTLVWQQGYTEWVPLSVLLGAPEDHVSLAPSLPPPQAVAPAYTSAPQAAPLPAPSLPPSMAYGSGPASVPAPAHFSNAPSYLPRPVSQPPNSAAYSAPAYTASLHPSAPATSQTPVYDTYMPGAFEVETPERVSKWYGRGLIAVAAIAMLVVAHRNGLTQSTAETLEQTASLGELEGKLGGPGIDTHHGLQKWLGETSERYKLGELSETEPVPEATAAAPKVGEKEAAEAAGEDRAAGDDPAAPEATGKTEVAAPAANAKPAAAVNFASSLSGKPAAAPVARSNKPKSTYRAPAAKRKQGAGDPNDPMNGDL